jgi:voltage-gated potassium channel Kch
VRIGVLGSGTVGRALATRFAELGHDVVVGTRDPAATAARPEWRPLVLPLVGFAEAAAAGQVVLNASSGVATLDVLRAAGAERARLIAVCTAGVEATNRIVGVARGAFPDTPLLVRSYDRRHSLDLIGRGVAGEVRETLESALVFGREALVALGVAGTEAERIERDVRRRDRERLLAQVEGGLFAGRDLVRAVRPEPLTPPRRAAADAGAKADARER